MINTIEEDFTGTQGLRIHMRSWTGDTPPKAVLAIVPGFNSHSGQYDAPARAFAAAGLAVASVDLRGRGKSEGPRFYVDTFDDYLSDVAQMLQIVRERHPALPVFLMGHSAGGVIASSYALEAQDKLAGLVCESFAYKVPAPDFLLGILRALQNVLPRVKVLKLPNAGFSRDPAAVAALNADPLIADERQPLRTVAEMSAANLRLKAGFSRFRLPLMILHGDKDAVTLSKGSEEFFANAGSADKVLKIYPDHVHDLLVDTGKEQVIADILAWIDARLPAP